MTRRGWLAAALLAGGAWQLAAWGWIEAKAWLAYGLIDRAWAATLASGVPERPWPWADTWPVARLHVPALGIERAVLHGTSGRTLAFAPGWDSASAPPGGHGVTLLGGHRDTHFRFLGALRAGDLVELHGRAGLARYRVESTAVLDVRTTRLVDDGGADRLLLVTCYPFEALTPGGPLRYLVSALREPAGDPVEAPVNL